MYKVLIFLCLVGFSNCGISNVGIIGGHKISIKKVPFMVSLRVDGIHHSCGGSIVNERFVLTAAHCIVPNRMYKVLVGTSRVDGHGELHDVEKIIVHQKYSNKTYNFDVCLIKLSKPLTFGPKVAPISLADYSVKMPKNTLLNVTGWGSTGVKRKSYSSQLLQVAIPKVTLSYCEMMYSRHQLPLNITGQMFCAGKEGKDSCQGDSGGPLTKGKFQVGITSFGLGCGVVPGIYTKVSAVLPWIKKTMAKNMETDVL